MICGAIPYMDQGTQADSDILRVAEALQVRRKGDISS